MKVLSVVNNGLNMIWQIHSYLENLKEIGWSKDTQILIYLENNNPLPQWDLLKHIYPEVQFYFYKGDKFTQNIIPIYLPIIRPYTLRQHFKQNVELENETIVYTDADILWTKKLDIHDKYSKHCYVSSTVFPNDYLSHEYLLSKRKQVDEDKLDSYDKIDILYKLADIVGITKQQIILNYNNCGGVQYILNGIDYKFWDKVMLDCLSIRVELQNINQQYMKGDNAQERETNGFQSWCADLWAVFYNLLYFNKIVEAPKELDFAWATDKLDRLKNCSIYHNAGITSDEFIRTTKMAGDGEVKKVDAPAFYKGKYTETTPFTDISTLKNIIDNSVSSEFCTSYYTNHLLTLQQKYNLNY